MSFGESFFLFAFMPITIIVYLLVDKLIHRDAVSNALLVLFSLAFYCWNGKETFWTFIQIVLMTYMAGYMALKKVSFPVICLTGVLFFYKYASFLAIELNKWMGKEFITLGTILTPLGISFVVFNGISYVVDIYRGDARPGSLLDCFTYLAFFPKLVSGPIVLWKDFYPQLKDHKASFEQVEYGIDRIIIGYAKKAIIADTFGSQISLITSRMAAGGVDIPSVWLRSLLYFFQLYFDFAGYSDIAIGLCSIFGFSIKENFNYPYLSKSISEFWRRWHISLGTWFREYIYIPLGGNRKGNVYLNLAIVFILTGIWHGTGLQFIVWGGVQAVCVMIERAIRNRKLYQKIPVAVKWFFSTAITFFSWILFMAKDLPSAIDNYKKLFIPMTSDTLNFTWQYYLSGRIVVFLFIAVLGCATGTAIIKKRIDTLLHTVPGITVKRISLILLFAVDILFVVNSTFSPFLYFQF